MPVSFSVIWFSKVWRKSRTLSASPKSIIDFSAVVRPPFMTMKSMSSRK